MFEGYMTTEAEHKGDIPARLEGLEKFKKDMGELLI